MKKNSKKVLMMGILVAVMIIVVTGVSLAFFNYTRTGTVNTLSVGRISFNHTQDGKIELSNIFPTSSANLNSNNSDTVTINITGDTTYTEGIEYKVTLEDVNNTINGKEVPISISATATDLGTEDSNYYTNRTNKTNIYLLNEEGDAYNGKYIAVGYIPSGATGVNGSIDITAFIDTNKVAISDTYDGTESDLMGTTNDWVMGREVFTTTEWNSFDSGNPLSFKVKVEANEGIWVEQEKFLTMKNIRSDSNWTAIRANITSIEFHTDGKAPANPITSFDVTDTTSDPTKGNITLYTIDDGLGNDTYKAIIVANDTIYAPNNSQGLFTSMSNLVIFNSKNFKVDNATILLGMFRNCYRLVNINSISNWNVSNVTNMSQMLNGCEDIPNLNSLSNWNVENVSSFVNTFGGCSNLQDSSGINDWDINPNANFTSMFGGNTPSHPEFTKFPNGTWSNGTFTPNA